MSKFNVNLSKMTKYIELGKIDTKYAKRMTHLSNKIFGEVARSTDQKSMKIVKLFSEKPINKRPEYVRYYPRLEQTHKLMNILRDYGLYVDEHEAFKEHNRNLRAAKGKDDNKKNKDKTVVLK